MSALLDYWAKAITGGLIAGGTYLMSVIAPTASLSSVTLVEWIGFAIATLGTAAGVGAMTNGEKPVKKDTPPAA